MNRVPKSLVLLGVLCPLGWSARADWVPTLADPTNPASLVSLVPLGDPQGALGSWEQHFRGGAGPFDLLAVQMASAGDFFETPAHNNFGQPTWSLEIDGSVLASASGTSVTSLEWDIRFLGDVSDPLAFDYVAFSGDEIVSAARASWSGGRGGWTITAFPGGEGAFWRPSRQDVVAVPAPGAALLSLIGLGSIAWIRRRVS